MQKSRSKRQLIEPHPSDKQYVRRIPKGKPDAGQIKTSVNVGVSLRDDRRTHAKKVVPPGQGDHGDQKRRGDKKK